LEPNFRAAGGVGADVGADIGARSTFVEGDVRITSARLTGFVVNELVFPASYAMRLDPERGYVGVVLEGALEKTFAHATRPLSPGSAFTMPPGAVHATRFSRCPTRVVVLHPSDDEPSAVPWGSLLSGFRETRDALPLGTALRLAGELRAQDDAWVLAAEGLCLDLIAGLLREQQSTAKTSTRAWLEPIRERLHTPFGVRPSLAELAATACVHPGYLARSFRAHYGVSIGEYVRRLRLDWAAAELTATETPLAVLAAEAGFADQSHFTRAFKRHTGFTPGRYRCAVRANNRAGPLALTAESKDHASRT
jgi:AraC family transcriptional regulator